MSKMLTVKCTWCQKEVQRYPSELMKNTYCSKDCRSKHLSKEYNPEEYRKHPHLAELNIQLNPSRMIDETKCKLRNARLNKGEGKTYEKTYGRHTHRIVAEQMLGRALNPREVVHHIDGNKRNNKPENLIVFTSQEEHAAYHEKQNKFFGVRKLRGGGAK